MNLTYKRIATNLNISTATAQRVNMLFKQTGNVDPRKRDHRGYERKLDERSELFVVGTILESPSLYLGEICQQIRTVFDVNVSPPTICRLIKRYGITRKKIRQIAKQRCDSLRGAFMAQCFAFSSRSMFVWVDETGTDNRDHIRKYGYALRGVTPTSKRLLVRGKRINAISALSSEGMLATEMVTETVNGERFYDFIRGTLIPVMRPFNGVNSHSVLVMDNCSIHHIIEVKEILRGSGIVLLFLPPYSPDLNPLEEAFSYIKAYLRKHDDLLQAVQNPSDVIQAAFDSITTDHCNSWITHAGYT